MSKQQKAVARFDVNKLQKAIKLDNGFLKAPVFATRTGVFKYVRSDGTVLREYRPESEVFDQDSLESLAGVPLTNRHPAKLVDSKNARKFTVGHVSDNVAREDIFVKTAITVMDEKTINDIEIKGIEEVSCGYLADLDFTPGITEDGEEYDAIQRNIRYNHLAVVERGRAGPQVRIKLDSDAAIHEDGLNLLNPKPSEREDIMAKVTLNGAEFEVDAGVATAINSALDKANKEGRDTANKEKKKDADALQTKIDEAQAKIDTLQEENEKLKNDSLSEEDLQKRVDERAQLMEKAKPLLKKDTDIAKMSNLEIKKAVIVEKSSLKEDDERLKSETYVDARFDGIIETIKPEAKKDNKLNKTLKEIEEHRKDGDDELDSDKSRQKSMQADSELWMKPISGAVVKPNLGGQA